jgi:SOS-response transcriptional repressor LexA
MDLAARLRAAINALGQTQSWVAGRANVPEETVSRIVTRETKNPQIGTLLKLAPVLGVTVAWLVGEKTAPFTESEARSLAHAMEILRGRLRGGAVDAREEPNATPIARATGARPPRADAWPELHGVREDDIPRESAARGARWIFRAEGESMSGRGILHGDRLYVRETADVRQAMGDVVVCRLAGSLYAKRLEFAGTIELVSENDRYERIVVNEKSEEFALFGIVVGRAGEV